MSIQTRAVKFSEVPVGKFFKENKPADQSAASWILKSERGRGLYRSFGTTYEPHFGQDELVLMDVNDIPTSH